MKTSKLQALLFEIYLQTDCSSLLSAAIIQATAVIIKLHVYHPEFSNMVFGWLAAHLLANQKQLLENPGLFILISTCIFSIIQAPWVA